MTKKTTILLLMVICAFQLSLAQNTINDVTLLAANLNSYSLPSQNNSLEVNVKNNGNTPIETLTVTWSDGTKNHEAIIKADIPAGATKRLVHPTPINYSGIVDKNITVSLGQNGVNDFNASDNSTYVSFNTVTRQGTKGVLYEKGTATWCRGCPMGIAAFNHMDKKKLESFIAVAIHARDPMDFDEYKQRLNFRTIPSYNLDRTNTNGAGRKFPTADCLEKVHEKRKKLSVPADLSLKVEESGNTLSITASAEFFSNFSAAGFKLGVIVTENNVTGTTEGYNQVNGFSGDPEVDCGGFEDLPNPVPAAQMVYNHVARALLGGYDGQSGSVPSVISAGNLSKYTFNYEVPAEIKKENLVFIAVLIRDGGLIANAKKQAYKGGLSISKENIASMQIYPNPVSNNINIDFDATEGDYEVSIYDMAGRSVYQKNFSNLYGKQHLTVPVDKISTGSYIVSVASKKSSYTKHIIVK